MKSFKKFLYEASLNGGTASGAKGYQSPEENQKIATNIINTISPELQKAGFQVKQDLSGKNQQPNIDELTNSQNKLLLITTDFSVGWDGKNRAGAIKVYVNPNHLGLLQQTINNINHPFVKMGEKAFYYTTYQKACVLIIFDDGVDSTQQQPNQQQQAAPAPVAPAAPAPAAPAAPAPAPPAPK
jgi:hypothetical protein